MRRFFRLSIVLLLAAALLGMVAGCSRKTAYAETSVADRIKITDCRGYSMYYGAGLFSIDMPGYTFRIECDKAFVRESTAAGMMGEHEMTYDGEGEISVVGRHDEYDPDQPPENFLALMLDESEAEVRIMIMDGNRIAGYALLCFWGAETGVESPLYDSQRVVKAVTFDEVDGKYPDVTEEQVNALLDKAVQELVIDAKLYETH